MPKNTTNKRPEATTKSKKSLYTTPEAVLHDNKEYRKYLIEHRKELHRLEREARGESMEHPDPWN